MAINIEIQLGGYFTSGIFHADFFLLCASPHPVWLARKRFGRYAVKILRGNLWKFGGFIVFSFPPFFYGLFLWILNTFNIGHRGILLFRDFTRWLLLLKSKKIYTKPCREIDGAMSGFLTFWLLDGRSKYRRNVKIQIEKHTVATGL